MSLYNHYCQLLFFVWNRDIFIQFAKAKLQGKPLEEIRAKLLDS